MHFVFNNYHQLEPYHALDGTDTADAYRRSLEFSKVKGHLVGFIRLDNVTSRHLRLFLRHRTLASKPLT